MLFHLGRFFLREQLSVLEADAHYLENAQFILEFAKKWFKNRNSETINFYSIRIAF